MPIEDFDLRKYITEMIPKYGKTCIYCRTNIKERKLDHIKERNERGRILRNMMLNLRNDEVRDWGWHNQQGINKLQKYIKGGYWNMYLNKVDNIKDLVEAQTTLIKIKHLIKKDNENNY